MIKEKLQKAIIYFYDYSHIIADIYLSLHYFFHQNLLDQL